MHRLLFGVSVVMFMISAVILGLIMQELNTDAPLIRNRQAQIILAITQYVIGDLIIIWRVWVVWGHAHLLVVGPLIMLIVGAGFAFNLLNAPQGFYTMVPAILIVANTSICTILISGRIWYLHRRLSLLGNRGAANSHYKGIMLLIIESGALYTAVQVVSLILNLHNSPVLPIMLDLEIPLIGILPTLIVVLVQRDLIASSSSTRSNSSQTPLTAKRSVRVYKEPSGYLASPHRDVMVIEPRYTQEFHSNNSRPPPKRDPNFYVDV